MLVLIIMIIMIILIIMMIMMMIIMMMMIIIIIIIIINYYLYHHHHHHHHRRRVVITVTVYHHHRLSPFQNESLPQRLCQNFKVTAFCISFVATVSAHVTWCGNLSSQCSNIELSFSVTRHAITSHKTHTWHPCRTWLTRSGFVCACSQFLFFHGTLSDLLQVPLP